MSYRAIYRLLGLTMLALCFSFVGFDLATGGTILAILQGLMGGIWIFLLIRNERGDSL